MSEIKEKKVKLDVQKSFEDKDDWRKLIFEYIELVANNVWRAWYLQISPRVFNWMESQQFSLSLDFDTLVTISKIVPVMLTYMSQSKSFW